MQNEILKNLDLKHIWHPCTQMKDHENLPLIPIKKAKGVWLYDFDDKAYMDCVSSWWVNLFGHCNEKISNAIKKQVDELEHVILAGFTHEPIIKLSARLCEKMGRDFNKCFYADNGSSAVEIALKMSFHYHFNKGLKKNKFLSLSNAYHGETLGALSVGDVALYKDTYKALLLECLSVSVPQNKDYAKELEILKDILKKHASEICAFILEPLVQCAGNMHMYEAGFIDEAIKLCHAFNVQVIFDEIATGFGRTRTLFALHQCKQSPDFICLSKGFRKRFAFKTFGKYDLFYATLHYHKGTNRLCGGEFGANF